MVRLRLKEILEEQGHTGYWFCKHTGMCYRNYQNLSENRVTMVRFDTLDRIAKLLEVPVGELFEQLPDDEIFD